MSEKIEEKIEEQVEQEIEKSENCCENKECEEKKEESSEDIIAKLQEELKQSEEKFLRVHADFENIKKRLEKEKFMAIDYASEKFAKDILTPLDTLEMALKSSEADIKAEELLPKIKEGIELTIKSFLSTFEKHGVSKVETDGDFDPNFHDAVMQVDSENHKTGEIVAELQKGYVLKDRLLRPAMVSIAN